MWSFLTKFRFFSFIEQENQFMKSTLVAKKSKIHGKGLFSTEKIQKGAVLGYCKTVALKNIKPGEELTHHYGDEWEDSA